MRGLFSINLLLIFASCKTDNKLALEKMKLHDSQKKAIRDNKIDTTFLVSQNKILKLYDSDTIGFLVYDSNGNTIYYSRFEINGTEIEFRYDSHDLLVHRGYYTCTEVYNEIKYSFDLFNKCIYQYYIASSSHNKSFVDTCIYTFNKSGQLIYSDAPYSKFSGGYTHVKANYFYGTSGELKSISERMDYFNMSKFTLYHPLAPQMITRFYYSNQLDSSIKHYYLMDKEKTVVKSVTYYHQSLPVKTVLCDTIITKYLHR